jgi:transposase
MSVLEVALDPATVIVAVDPGKAFHRVWVSDGSGLLADPMSLPVTQDGICHLERMLDEKGSTEPVIAVEATGSLHGPWVSELERRHPGSVRVFAPSETKSARMQLGSGRFKSDDRDCAALIYLARQGGGRRYEQQSPADADRRAWRLGRDLDRYRRLQADVAAVDEEIAGLLPATEGQVLTTLPGVGTIRAAAFAAHSLPIERFPDAEHLYSATGLAPALYQSATLHRRGRISRQGLAEHRDALMGIAWGLSQNSPSFAARNAELRARGMAPIQARVALARHACRLAYRLLRTQQPFDEQRYRRGRLGRER